MAAKVNFFSPHKVSFGWISPPRGILSVGRYDVRRTTPYSDQIFLLYPLLYGVALSDSVEQGGYTDCHDPREKRGSKSELFHGMFKEKETAKMAPFWLHFFLQCSKPIISQNSEWQHGKRARGSVFFILTFFYFNISSHLVTFNSEWKLTWYFQHFAALSGSGHYLRVEGSVYPKIVHTQNLPSPDNLALCFCPPPLESYALKFCPPPSWYINDGYIFEGMMLVIVI